MSIIKKKIMWNCAKNSVKSYNNRFSSRLYLNDFQFIVCEFVWMRECVSMWNIYFYE